MERQSPVDLLECFVAALSWNDGRIIGFLTEFGYDVDWIKSRRVVLKQAIFATWEGIIHRNSYAYELLFALMIGTPSKEDFLSGAISPYGNEEWDEVTKKCILDFRVTYGYSFTDLIFKLVNSESVELRLARLARIMDTFMGA